MAEVLEKTTNSTVHHDQWSHIWVNKEEEVKKYVEEEDQEQEGVEKWGGEVEEEED